MGGLRLIIVDDDPRVRSSLQGYLSTLGCIVVTAASVAEARARFDEGWFDAAIVERSLPDGDGAVLCQRQRELGDATPFVFLSSRTREQDVLEAYGMGADLYLRKPMGGAELAAHLVAVTRATRSKSFYVGPSLVDTQRCLLVRADGATTRLASQEAAFLARLSARRGEVVTRAELIAALWTHGEPDANGLDVLAYRIRRKLGSCAPMFETVRGRGFRLVAEPVS